MKRVNEQENDKKIIIEGVVMNINRTDAEY